MTTKTELTQLRNTGPFLIEEIQQSQLSEIREIVARWQVWAESFLTGSQTDGALEIQFSASAKMCRDLLEFALVEGEFGQRKTLVSKDQDPDQTIQAIFSVKETEGRVDRQSFLVTCPWNLSPIAGIKNHPVRGAGKSLILYFLQNQKDQGRTCVQITTLTSAQTFYQKLGFIAHKKDQNPFARWAGCVVMTADLTKE